MNSMKRSIVLLDQHIGQNSDWLKQLNLKEQEVVIFDPLKLFSVLDWTRYEVDVLVINTVYSQLFEELVMNNKRLVCFWPLDQQFGNEWFELASLCKKNNYEIELYKGSFFDAKSPGISEEILQSWKHFVYVLIESLIEDIQLNEQFDEIATLTSGNETIVLFKLEQEGKIKYSFSFDSDFFELAPTNNGSYSIENKYLESFDTFNEMLEKLLEQNDLSLYEFKFCDGSLEKAFFNLLSKEFKTTNLIQNWLKTYSMN
jgi:hypothetical protein